LLILAWRDVSVRYKQTIIGVAWAVWRLLYSLNPMAGVIGGFRWALLGGDSPLYLPGFTMSIALLSL
jgi:ABC-type polysaccharide/polyol phosphate export permease